MTLFIISFIAGLLTVLAPCILPLLPIIVGGSLGKGSEANGRKRAVVITLSLGVSVIVFTLALKVSTAFINIPQSVWSIISGSIVLFFGIITLFPELWERLPFMARFNQSSQALLNKGYQKKSIWGDIIIGASLGPVFSSCSPTYFIILATVLPQQPLVGLFYLLTYTVGLCLGLLFIALVGQRIMNALGIAADPHGWFKRTLGALFIIVGVAVLTGYDKIIEAKLLTSGIFDITKVEQKLLQFNKPSSSPTPVTATSTTGTTPKYTFLSLAEKAKEFPLAHELVNPSGFVNTNGQPITIGEFKGKKVVLLDVWTYSCINCQRTLPYVTAWDKKYKDQGLEIIGLHTPEFAFEKNIANVQDAVKRFGIEYPVVLDNSYSTWNAYGNQYWPRKYLIDIDGYVVYDHIGEGEYDVTEAAIQKALAERADRLHLSVADTTSAPVKPKDVITFDESKIGSPEVYFGTIRNEFLANGQQNRLGAQTLTIPATIDPNKLYLGGSWNFTLESAENTSEATIVFKYQAKNVYMVASSNAGSDIEITRDGVALQAHNGADVNTQGVASVKEERLYSLVKDTAYGEHTLRIHIKNPGLKAFTFTFG